MTKTLVPPKDRKEWTFLVTTKLDHKFQNLVMQLKIMEFKQKKGTDKIDIMQSIDELYELSTKYAVSLQNDFQVIFKKW
ncbi:hypothetical protein SanaruYs_36880 [Chryseotalea sanaruensis]|uniref:Uncharacterized protein n=1 Tax=Chryseotalea sanaruensis TaxID=2482724 RepID=A0A401UF16_9BACT|nr:hypothetical protein [Chryseotalea sanaruensis]GCC53444.1 hypothetical protein SanaruYs_36880 [Chryseotalea sanaruensis]